MSRENRDPSSPAKWIRRARSNLARARADHGLEEVLYEDLCIDAQQAAEKAIRALLVQRGVAFPRTHDIIDLLTLVQQSGLDVPPEIREADLLTQYAVVTRYPGLSEEVAFEDYEEAIGLADRVMKWVSALLEERKP